MKAYEGLFVFPPDSTPEVRKNQLKNLDDLIAKFKGQVTQKLEWGKKPMGYSVNKNAEGFILVYDFQMPSSEAVEFRKGIDLQEDLMKYMITVKRQEKIKPEKKAAAPKAPVSAAPAKPSVKVPQAQA